VTTTDAPPLTIVQPGDGTSGTLGSVGVDFKLWEIASRYGLQFGQPGWLPDVISRYNLTPPPENTVAGWRRRGRQVWEALCCRRRLESG
jgi:hypothetical protein